MAAKLFLEQYAWDERYRVCEAEGISTPALVIYRDEVEHNLDVTLKALSGDAQRWRPHVKTAKLEFVMRIMTQRGIYAFKCATTLELRVALHAGARDVLVAYPLVGPGAVRVREIAEEFRDRRISVLIENRGQLEQWSRSRVGVFLDVNPGMDRTGIEQGHREQILELVREITTMGVTFRGLHYYDGHLGGLPLPDRTAAAHRGYEELMGLVRALHQAGTAAEEVITAGTAAFLCSLSYAAFRTGRFLHRVSPGTVVYCDATSLAQLPSEYGYRPAALVMSRLVSQPRADMITCDAGHKTVSADAGVPTCVPLGHPKLEPLSPSEEHLPMLVHGGHGPGVGDVLYLMPRHICPTVNNFDDALIASGGRIQRAERVTARGREHPLTIRSVVQQG